jgi:hypothetical protein
MSGKITRGWELLSICTITGGSPFTVYSGVQQTGAGTGGTDRPDLIEMPLLSTARPVREDYFGRGENNASFFYIPIHVPGGTGPNQGRYGTLGRNTFFSPVVRIQTERGHHFIAKGPYRPAAGFVAVIFRRTRLEDEFLVTNLRRYKKYAALVPSGLPWTTTTRAEMNL